MSENEPQGLPGAEAPGQNPSVGAEPEQQAPPETAVRARPVTYPNETDPWHPLARLEALEEDMRKVKAKLQHM